MVNPRFELASRCAPPLDAAVFADFGNLYVDPSLLLRAPASRSARTSAPASACDTPVGPLVFDYGINVTRRPYEDFGAFHFAIGLF